jgi:hypothetical protein
MKADGDRLTRDAATEANDVEFVPHPTTNSARGTRDRLSDFSIGLAAE